MRIGPAFFRVFLCSSRWRERAGVDRASEIFRRQSSGARKERHNSERAQPGQPGQRGEPVVEQPDVAAELVDDEAGEPRLLAGRQQRVGPDELGDDAAAFDVADQCDRDIGGLSKPHIGNVAVAQIDLGRAAGAFDQDQVGRSGEPRERVHYRRQKARCQAAILAGRGIAPDPAGEHELGAVLRLRLQQHRVHVGERGDAAGARLDRLRPADLAAIGGHCRVVRHVLRLERPHLQAVPGVGARQPGQQ